MSEGTPTDGPLLDRLNDRVRAAVRHEVPAAHPLSVVCSPGRRVATWPIHELGFGARLLVVTVELRDDTRPVLEHDKDAA